MENRTPDLVHAKHALYQLSYIPRPFGVGAIRRIEIQKGSAQMSEIPNHFKNTTQSHEHEKTNNAINTTATEASVAFHLQ